MIPPIYDLPPQEPYPGGDCESCGRPLEFYWSESGDGYGMWHEIPSWWCPGCDRTYTGYEEAMTERERADSLAQTEGINA